MLLLLVLFILPFPVWISGETFSFCSENEQFVFSAEACPGGILFKKSINIDQSCYCFPSDLQIRSSCDRQQNHNIGIHIAHSVLKCSKSEILNVTWNQDARLLFPLKSKTDPENYQYCPSIRQSCKLSKENIQIENPSIKINEIEDVWFGEMPTDRIGRKTIRKRSLEDEYNMFNVRRQRNPADIMSSTEQTALTPEAVPEQIQIDSVVSDKQSDIETTLSLIERMGKSVDLNVQELEIGKIFKNLMTRGIEIDENIIPSYIFKDISKVFLNILAGVDILDLEDLDVDKTVYSAYKDCFADVGKVKYKFVMDNSCPLQPVAWIHPKTKAKISIADLKASLPEEYKYVPQKEDLVLSFAWKWLEMVHAECYGIWSDKPTVFGPVFKLFSFAENYFHMDSLSKIFYPRRNDGTSKYEGIITSDKELTLLMEHLDVVAAAVHYRSKYSGFLHKPRKVSFKQQTRKKRQMVGVKDFEIWGGRAYCLQKVNPSQPAGFANSYPRIQYLCNL